jgi:4-nitrophenyl phosphatase
MPEPRLRAPFDARSLFVLDMDGTIYLGNQLFPWTLPFLAALKANGATALFLTNNSSKTADEYVAKLCNLGVAAGPENVLTSGDATIDLLRREGRYRKLFLLAPPAVARQFSEAGFEVDAKAPDAVVMAYDTTLEYGRLTTFCHHVRAGVPYLATHPDFNCPTPAGPIPDTGSFMALVEASTGRQPDRIVGKPQAAVLEAAMARFGAHPQQTLMIGDRLYTDIACGNAAGVDSVLVLSGESTRAMVATSPHVPTHVVENLSELLL